MKEYLSFRRIKQIGPKTIIKILHNDIKLRINERHERRFFKNIDSYLIACSEDVPFKSKNGLRIKLIETSFHRLSVVYPNGNNFLNNFIDSTGAFATYYELDNGETILLVAINSDVYDNDLCPKYIKYFTIAHEIGHCINEDQLNDSLYEKYGRDIYNEKRAEIPECIEKEMNADKTGYEQIIIPGWFGDFKYNSELTLSRQYRVFQHELNYMTCLFGLENIDLLMKTEFTHTKDICQLSQYFVDYTSNHTTTEDIKRKELFDKYFA